MKYKIGKYYRISSIYHHKHIGKLIEIRKHGYYDGDQLVFNLLDTDFDGYPAHECEVVEEIPMHEIVLELLE